MKNLNSIVCVPSTLGGNTQLPLTRRRVRHPRKGCNTAAAAAVSAPLMGWLSCRRGCGCVCATRGTAAQLSRLRPCVCHSWDSCATANSSSGVCATRGMAALMPRLRRCVRHPWEDNAASVGATFTAGAIVVEKRAQSEEAAVEAAAGAGEIVKRGRSDSASTPCQSLFEWGRAEVRFW